MLKTDLEAVRLTQLSSVMKKQLTVLLSLTLSVVACSNPKSDAKEVCDCIQKSVIAARDNPDDKSALKCMALGTEKALKYKEKPQELLEFNMQMDSCTNNFK
ncbi:hypothetical protein [Pedobacter sp. SL55]|uniref:hypothetical protein n=1 Tax=Pedobacter sp. SL55 TaxID=2995161 RepID=UPI00226D91AB|nr:hypothetical protein [Pedobacter sp. SL55]WAC39349.1 hypothetical protein OVA16_12110 [Pedobacter sp. SL55]